MAYLSWNEKKITDFSPNNISELFDQGYVFTRIAKGEMRQTRSARIDLAAFSLSSENRRIIKKTEGLTMEVVTLPYTSYDFSLGKLAKDFYDTKFAPGTMSAQKVKEMLTNVETSNFNTLLMYSLNGEKIGYTIAYESSLLLHYSYPFYNLEKSPKDMGMGMMLRAIIYAQEKGLRYIYLGSLQRPGDSYKLQFDGLEWFDGSGWQKDLDTVKAELKALE